MLCRHCQSLGPDGAHRYRLSRFPSFRGAERIRAMMCVACGTLLPPVDPTDLMLEKLAQLARFGLSAEGGPLLEASRRPS